MRKRGSGITPTACTLWSAQPGREIGVCALAVSQGLCGFQPAGVAHVCDCLSILQNA